MLCLDGWDKHPLNFIQDEDPLACTYFPSELLSKKFVDATLTPPQVIISGQIVVQQPKKSFVLDKWGQDLPLL